MTNKSALFVDVILPVSIYREFTYRVPEEMNNEILKGVRVVVPFGKSKYYTAIVVNIHENAPKNYSVKYIEHILDEQPIINGKQYNLWKWIAQYYMAAIGDVLNAALPSNFKLASETIILIHPDYKNNENYFLSKNETLIMEALEILDEKTLKDLSELLKVKNIHPIITQLIAKKLVITREELNQKYTPKKESFVWLNPVFSTYELSEIINTLEKQGKTTQIEALLQLEHLKKELQQEYIPKKTLLDSGVSTSTVNTLKKNGLIEVERLEVSRIRNNSQDVEQIKELSQEQQKAYQEIQKSFKEHLVTLLFGVTGSGKTEIYMQLIQEQLDSGKQVLFLLPEIALTTQLIQRLSIYFGTQIGVYHSKFNPNERIEIWNAVLSNNPTNFRLIVGARSSIFLPFQDLGLIIVDEEHESSFKQYDPAPRYNARDTAMILARLHNAKILLGSATPSIETYYNAINGKYGLVKLTSRFSGVKLPQIECVDMKTARRLKNMKEDFSITLLDEIKNTLDKQKQIILFQNRRGYTPLWMCEVCNWTPRCKNCDVTLTYHKQSHLLKCHYCSHTQTPMGTCKSCGSTRIKMLGFGTEKIEDDLKTLLPDANIQRLDLDTTRNKNAYQNIILNFENQQIDILIGTQMISKGLDFKNVALVGILDADLMLQRSDFRAFERSFQMMSQVAGRAGRHNEQGKVLIQTKNIDHWVIKKIMQHDYTGFYETEIIERNNYFYPPYYKIINIVLKHKDEKKVSNAANELSQMLYEVFKERVLGPEFPTIKRIQNLFLKQIKIKIEKNVPDIAVKEKISELIDQFYTRVQFKSVRVAIDVDPN